jgi:hypothetical protein|tara:strand:+ start:116784 stop:116951 length:168 start_codon:yes stop_codon:yes gene_type:complete
MTNSNHLTDKYSTASWLFDLIGGCAGLLIVGLVTSIGLAFYLSKAFSFSKESDDE